MKIKLALIGGKCDKQSYPGPQDLLNLNYFID